jgi:hypothetical protein
MEPDAVGQSTLDGRNGDKPSPSTPIREREVYNAAANLEP